MKKIISDCNSRALQELLKGLRIKKGLSQQQVLQESGVDVSKYETDDCMPKSSSIAKLCELYDIRFAGFWIVFEEYINGKISLVKAIEILDHWSNHDSSLQMAIDMIVKNQDVA
ncbi:MAG: helix-turn-helix transcriptional regulator [candidate division Zixibacteria bacterium]|nr:helix-turn-helix transcriptional regulator [candidate division Zixibacteria bacterium]